MNLAKSAIRVGVQCYFPSNRNLTWRSVCDMIITGSINDEHSPPSQPSYPSGQICHVTPTLILTAHVATPSIIATDIKVRLVKGLLIELERER